MVSKASATDNNKFSKWDLTPAFLILKGRGEKLVQRWHGTPSSHTGSWCQVGSNLMTPSQGSQRSRDEWISLAAAETMATPGPGIKWLSSDLHDSMQALRLLPSDRGGFENETKGWYMGMAYLRTISWSPSLTSKVWISEMRGTQGLWKADGDTTAGVSWQCILFIYSECHRHPPPSVNTNHLLVTPAYAFSSHKLICCFKADGKNQKSLKKVFGFGGFVLLVFCFAFFFSLSKAKSKDRIMPLPKIQCETLRTTLFRYS